VTWTVLYRMPKGGNLFHLYRAHRLLNFPTGTSPRASLFLLFFYKSFTIFPADFRNTSCIALAGGLVLAPTLDTVQPRPVYRDEHLTVEFGPRTVLVDGLPIALTRKEYALLAMLVQHAQEIVPRNALLLQIWNYGAGVKTRTLDVHVRRLRKKLGSYADRYIETIFGIGYRFQPYDAPRFDRPALPLSA
jgi:hypothetical protein